MSELQEDTNKLNAYAEDWGRETVNAAKAELRRFLSSEATMESTRKLRSKTKQVGGEVEVIYISNVQRHLIFFHKDVGRGRPVDRAARNPRPWLNNAMDKQTPKLREFLTNNFQDRVIKSAQLEDTINM